MSLKPGYSKKSVRSRFMSAGERLYLLSLVIILSIIGGCVSAEDNKITIDLSAVKSKAPSLTNPCSKELKEKLSDKVKKSAFPVEGYKVIEVKKFNDKDSVYNYIISYESVIDRLAVRNSIDNMKAAPPYYVAAGVIEYQITFFGMNKAHAFLICNSTGTPIVSLGL